MEANERVKASCRNEGERYFSVAAMFVGFREALEACVIISVSPHLYLQIAPIACVFVPPPAPSASENPYCKVKCFLCSEKGRSRPIERK